MVLPGHILPFVSQISIKLKDFKGNFQAILSTDIINILCWLIFNDIFYYVPQFKHSNVQCVIMFNIHVLNIFLYNVVFTAGTAYTRTTIHELPLV